MTPCHYSRVVIDSFAAHGAPDLPDALAEHLDDCGACRTHFDQLFQPWQAPAVRTPPRHRWPALLAVAATALLALLPAVPAPPPSLETSEVEVALADAECPVDDEHDVLAVCPLEGELY